MRRRAGLADVWACVRVTAAVDYPAFVHGERRCPPEDVGGVPGFMQFLEAAPDPLHEEHEQVVTW